MGSNDNVNGTVESERPLKATVNCDMGEGYSLYTMGDDESLMKTIHLANIACGFHASDFSIMDKTVQLAKANDVLVGAHPSLPDRQGFGRREMAIDPEELISLLTYQTGALLGFLALHNYLPLHHIKPHGALYGMTARDLHLAQAVVSVAKAFAPYGPVGDGVAIVGLAGTCHESAAREGGVRFIAEWFADLEYSPEGKLLITKKHDPIPLTQIESRVTRLLTQHLITTTDASHPVHIGKDLSEVSICCHSDTPGAVQIAETVKRLVDESNKKAGYVV